MHPDTRKLRFFLKKFLLDAKKWIYQLEKFLGVVH